MNSSTKIILGIVGAAAAGAVIGMMLAPEKGSELRQKVKESANDFANHIADLFAEGKQEFENMRKKASKEAGSAAQEASNRFNEAGERFNKVKESFS